jgi:D-tyrosyl-tRNA(Tyr) deacylase
VKALLQRVTHASVVVAGQTVGKIDRGILLLLGVEQGDDLAITRKLAEKVLNYRIFPDDLGRMNLSLIDINGGLLVVSQFTLAADTQKGLRPSFTPAANPVKAEGLYLEFVDFVSGRLSQVETGHFGADMQVALCNDGPVTFLLEG